jgi:hypothetical protein
MACQAFLTQPEAPQLWVLLDKAALRRPLGDQTWRAQLVHLTEIAQRSNATLQVCSVFCWWSRRRRCPFTILRFAEPDLPGTCPTLSNLEHLTNAVCLNKNATQCSTWRLWISYASRRNRRTPPLTSFSRLSTTTDCRDLVNRLRFLAPTGHIYHAVVTVCSWRQGLFNACESLVRVALASRAILTSPTVASSVFASAGDWCDTVAYVCGKVRKCYGDPRVCWAVNSLTGWYTR